MGDGARAQDDVRLRLSDSWVEMTGAALEAGGGAEALLADLAAGERFSVQFWDPNHPESISTEHGQQLTENFHELAGGRRSRRAGARPVRRPRAGVRVEPVAVLEPPRLLKRTLAGQSPTEALFGRLFAGLEHSFWLDSADAPTRLAQRSFMGTSSGPRACMLEFDVERDTASVRA